MTEHGNFASPEHAFYVGAILGIAMKNDIPLVPQVDDDGNYLPTLELRLSEHVTLTVHVPVPPTGWSINDWMDS